MKKEKQHVYFLAKWLSNDISAELLAYFKKTKDYSIYSKIIQSIDKLSVIDYPFKKAYLEFKILQKKYRK